MSTTGSDPKVSTPEIPSGEVLKESPIAKTEKVDAVKPPKSKGYSNPALRAMGLPPLKIPSRNWMIFWVVLAGGVGGAVYDSYQQKQIRKKWMNRVSKYGEQSLDPNKLARKVTIFVAPPPNDYLDESLSVFRKYVKPVLNSAGVDYEVRSENRQGVIRSTVAADIRALRREILQNEKDLYNLRQSAKWYNRIKSWFKKSNNKTNEEELLAKKFSDDFNLASVVGLYYKNQLQDVDVVNEDAEHVEASTNGGVICIGRGAYKEYLAGLHEGLLGPLEKPLEHKEFEEFNALKKQKAVGKIEEIEDTKDIIAKSPIVQNIDDINKPDEVIPDVVKPLENSDLNISDAAFINSSDKTKVESDEIKPVETPIENANSTETPTEDEDVDDNGEKLLPIPKPFIDPETYSQAKFAPEFDFTRGKIPTKNSVAPFFQQPILVIPVYHLLGFLSTPQRLYRFYTQRHLTEEYGKATVALVENLTSPFKLEDVDLAKGEESDWPKKWVEKGHVKNSEWVQEVKVDERVLSKLKVYDAERIKDE